MKTLAKTVQNPMVKDSVTFLMSAEDTGGEYGLVEVTLHAGGGTPLHYHTSLTEHFEAVNGVLSVQAGKKTYRLSPGESFTVPINEVHRFFNDTDSTITFRCTIRPARNFEKALRIGYGLAQDGKVTKSGVPKSLWHAAIVFELSESYLSGLPLWFQKLAFGLLAKIARVLGADKELEKYYYEDNRITG